jgi:hypothetical protein
MSYYEFRYEFKKVYRWMRYAWRYRREPWECFECKAWNFYPPASCHKCGAIPWKWLTSTVTLKEDE